MISCRIIAFSKNYRESFKSLLLCRHARFAMLADLAPVIAQLRIDRASENFLSSLDFFWIDRGRNRARCAARATLALRAWRLSSRGAKRDLARSFTWRRVGAIECRVTRLALVGGFHGLGGYCFEVAYVSGLSRVS